MFSNKIRFIFNSIQITEGFFNKKFDFTDGINLIYSKKNSVGKSSLLRLIIYSLGYSVPSTKKMKFNDFQTELNIKSAIGDTKIERADKYISVYSDNFKDSFSLPTELNNLLSKIYSIDNKDILENILGSYYLDQEHGWTLLNRGNVIGKIKFNIEGLVRGLSNNNCDKLFSELYSIKKLKKKYEYMFSVSEYKKELHILKKDMNYNDYSTEVKTEIDTLSSEKASMEEELRNIARIIDNNSKFEGQIEKIKLRVKSSTGEEIPVTKDTIIGYEDNNSYLINRKKMLASDISRLSKRIKYLEKQLTNESLISNSHSLIEKFDNQIAHIDKINTIDIDKAIKQLEKKITEIEMEISKETKKDKELISSLNNSILLYAEKLGLDKLYLDSKKDYIFTNDLKSLGGAILHKIVFIFKLSYIKTIKDRTGLVLPIVLDSPNGRETSRENVKDMMNILASDFSEHQIILASIYNDYNIGNINIIEIENRLMENI